VKREYIEEFLNRGIYKVHNPKRGAYHTGSWEEDILFEIEVLRRSEKAVKKRMFKLKETGGMIIFGPWWNYPVQRLLELSTDKNFTAKNFGQYTAVKIMRSLFSFITNDLNDVVETGCLQALSSNSGVDWMKNIKTVRRIVNHCGLNPLLEKELSAVEVHVEGLAKRKAEAAPVTSAATKMSCQGVKPWGALVKQLECYCEKRALSLDVLQAKIQLIPPGAIQASHFFHLACANNSVTTEIIELILNLCPAAATTVTTFFSCRFKGAFCESWAYPLHLACLNSACPNSAIEFLMKKYQPALHQSSSIEVGFDGYKSAHGVPLHCYLGRSSNMDLATVKMLLDAYPEGALRINKYGKTPTHTLVGNCNIHSLNDVLKFLVQSNPASLREKDTEFLGIPLHDACFNQKIDPNTIQLLLDNWPESIFQQNSNLDLPIDVFFKNDFVEEVESVKILALYVEFSPAWVRQVGESGSLPIHHAAKSRSPAFCEVLINAYPEALKIQDEHGRLPIHIACRSGRPATVKYLLQVYPESILAETAGSGYLPIHLATQRPGSAETIQVLLTQDPDGASRATTDLYLPLYFASRDQGTENLKAVQLLFDSYPEAIFERRFIANPRQWVVPSWVVANPLVFDFLKKQMKYAYIGRDISAMTTVDGNGWFPLHRALHGDASLGAIKLLVKGNIDALQVADHNLSYPLHIACEFSTPDVVEFLLESNESCLNHCDNMHSSSLHYACRGGNYGAVLCLLERGVSSVSERNSENKLPIQLLYGSGNDKVDNRSPEYVETLWRLLLAYPETVLNFN